MNTQAGQHGHNPVMLAALQQQQQQQQQQHGHSQMNTAMMNGMPGMNGLTNMNATQQQQLQQMLAAKYQGAGMGMGMPGGNAGAGGGFNPQMMQYQQQQQLQGGGAGGAMSVNPQALMNMGGMNMGGMGMGGMNGRGNMGSGAGFNQQMFAPQSQAQYNQASGRPGTGGGMGGVNPQMLMQQHIGGGAGMGGPSGTNNSQHIANGGMSNMAGMNNMSNGMMGMGGGGGGGGMNMSGMGGMNPQSLNMGINAGPGSVSSPQPPHTQPSSINPAALNAPVAAANVSSNMGVGMGMGGGMGGGGGMPNLGNIQLSPMQLQTLQSMNPQERNKTLQRLMAHNLQQHRDMQYRRSSGDTSMHGRPDGGMQGMGMGGGGMGMQTHGQRDTMPGQGLDGMMGGMPTSFTVGMGGMNNNGMMGMDNLNMSTMGGMQGMNGGVSGVQGMGGLQGMTPAQIQQMYQHAQGQGDRPTSSMAHQSQGQHASPTQPHAAFPSQGQQSQAQSPARTHTPHQQNALMQQQHMQQQHHANANVGMMPPPSSIPPRPPTSASSGSPAPRPGTGGGLPGTMGPPNQFGQHVQHGAQQHHYGQSPRPGTSGATGAPSPAAAISRAGSSMGMHHSPQSQQHQQLQQHQMGQQGLPAPSPIPIQPRPAPPNARASGSPAPIPRPGTSQSMHGGASSGLRAITPAMVGSRPGTATGFRQQPGTQPSTPQAGMPSPTHPQQPQGQQQTHTPISTPTSATYPPIAPAPATGSVPGSPKVGSKRKVSLTPGPSSVGGTPVPMSGPEQQQVMQQQGQGQMHGQPQQGPQGMQGPGTNITPAQMANMRMSGGNMMNMPNGLAAGGMMGPPVLPRVQQPGQPQLPGGGAGAEMGVSSMNGMATGMGVNGMQVPGMARQPSVGDLRNNNAIPTSATNAAGLSINTNINQGMNPQIPMGNSGMSVPPSSAVGSPNPAMLVDPTLPVQPVTPRQASQPPTSGSPFPAPGMMGVPGSAERKMAGPGLLAGAPPISRSSTGDVFTAPPVTTSSAASGTTSSAPAQGTTQIIPQLPPLPTNVSLNPKVTRVSVVPLIDSETTIPALKPEEIESVKEWMKADKKYEARYKKMQERMSEEVRDCIVKRKAWYDKDPLEDPRSSSTRRRKEKFDLIGLKTGKEEKMRKKVGKREGFKLPRAIDPEEASRPEQLVPIRLEFDVDHHKMRDTFVWNLNDPIITPEIFAQSIVDDYSLAPNYHTVITKTIQDQLSDYKAHSTTFGEDGFDDVVLKGQIEDEDGMWWDTWKGHVRSDVLLKSWEPRSDTRSRKRRKIVKDEVEEPTEVPSAPGLDVYMSVDEFEEDESKTLEEMRILVKLDIIVGPVKLEDQFEWDIDSPDPSPEHFAAVYAKELGLGGEFRTAIAHSIREQVQIYQKSLFLVGHPSDGSAVQDEDLRLSFLPSLSTGARSMDQVVAFTPRLDYLSDGELERNEKEREKELNRRRRKTTRGRRGVALPDREPPKTYRTPAIGFPEVDPATLALVNANAAPTSRRAAAAAASLTIANMVASENGTSLSPQTMPAPVPTATIPQQTTAKEKKPKGLMKAPSYPASVLRPRAQVKAPTPSTAADPATVQPPLDIDPPVTVAPAENKGARVPLSAKRAKELEREAKEKEYVDGQHANYIDGIWHCSNCGCPESIAVGRRKGPLGDKSQCGTCGKFWHRHRRPRPVEYNSSLEYHMNLKREEEQARLAASRRKRPQAHAIEAASSKAPTVEPETPRKPSPDLPDEKPVSQRTAPATPHTAKAEKLELPGSPMSSASSISEPPLAQRTKTNGAGHPTPTTLAIAPSQSESSESVQDTPQDSPAVPSTTTPTSAGAAPRPGAGRPSRDPPAWLKDAMKELNEKYPDDRFEAVLRKGPNPAQPEWRIKCTDCPGKLYTPGPGETLTNYEVHLKNRQHRQKVNGRLSGGASQS